MKKLSVITISMNNVEGLKRTINSVASQSEKDFNFIIADGGSNDGTTELIKSNESIVSKWISEKDNGIYNAQNKGIRMAYSQYCLFLNAGDELASKDVVKNFYSLNHDADIIYGDMIVDKDGKRSNYLSPDKITLRRMLTDTIWHPVSFIQKSLFDKIGNYDESFKITGDYDFFVKAIVKEKVKTLHVNFPVAVFYDDGISSDQSQRNKLVEERKKVHDRYFNPFILFFYRLYGKMIKW